VGSQCEKQFSRCSPGKSKKGHRLHESLKGCPIEGCAGGGLESLLRVTFDGGIKPLRMGRCNSVPGHDYSAAEVGAQCGTLHTRTIVRGTSCIAERLPKRRKGRTRLACLHSDSSAPEKHRYAQATRAAFTTELNFYRHLIALERRGETPQVRQVVVSPRVFIISFQLT
jgi:hypothetical protein